MIASHTGHNEDPARPLAMTARSIGKAAGKILLAVILLGFLTHMSWNMFGPDMFGLEPIRMKQALGLVVFAGVFASLLRFGVRHAQLIAPETK
ncbi:MAG: hypothetical protein V3U23_05535 [Kiloniellales bacterium]